MSQANGRAPIKSRNAALLGLALLCAGGCASAGRHSSESAGARRLVASVLEQDERRSSPGERPAVTPESSASATAAPVEEGLQPVDFSWSLLDSPAWKFAFATFIVAGIPSAVALMPFTIWGGLDTFVLGFIPTGAPVAFLLGGPAVVIERALSGS